jgi:hypothetical protein
MMITHALDSNTNSARLRRLGRLNLLDKAASHLSDQGTSGRLVVLEYAPR